MQLLDDQLRARLPPLHAQEAEDEPMVYARFFLPGSQRAWYPLEGEPVGEDFMFFGWLAPNNEFAEFRLSELQAIRGLFDSHVERDPAFREGRLTDVVPAPDM